MRRVSGVLVIGLAVVAAVCCVWTWMSVTYLLGTGVSVNIGDECLSKFQSGRAGTIECWDASWPIDGAEHRGSLIDYRQTGGVFEFDVIKARAFGDTARTRPPYVTFAAGLAGPVLLIAAGVVFLRSRREPRVARVGR